MAEQVQLTDDNADSEQRAIMMVALVVWSIGVVAGLKVMLDTAVPTAAAATMGSNWPSGSHLVRAPGTPNLVMFANPRANCSHDDVDALATWMAGQSEHVNAQLVWVSGAATQSTLSQNDTWKRAGTIAGVALGMDEGGVEAGRFGARASGQTWVFDREGALLYTGGIAELPAFEGLSAQRPLLTDRLTPGTCRLAEP